MSLWSDEGRREDEQPRDSNLEEICELPNGSTLFRESNEAGGYRYWSDEIGGGVCVWDTCLTASSTLLTAIAEEERRVRAQQRKVRDHLKKGR